MNKYQRAKSKAIKRYIRIARAQGVYISYRQAKRIDRKVKQFAVNVASLIIRGNLRTLEELKLDGARLRGAVETTAKILCVTLDATLDTPEGDEAHAEN